MPRLNHVKKAQKSQGQCARCGKRIKIGDSYYWFANRIGRSSIRKNFCSAHRPRPSDMTTSDKLSRVYAAQESVEDGFARADEKGNLIPFDDFKSDVAQSLNDAANEIREVADEYRDSVENMPENLQQSSQADEMNQKADDLESWADEIESAASDVEDMELPEGEDADVDSAYQEVEDKATDAVASRPV